VVVIPIPSTFDLAPVTPNPSGGEIAIEFNLPDAGPVHLDIVDVSGRSLKRWDVGPLGPGRHVLSWVGERTLPAGLYFARLRHGATMKSREFAIVR
jgi:hypothetical protein